MNLYGKLNPDGKFLFGAVIILILALLALLTLLVRQGVVNSWDNWLLAWLHARKNPFLDMFFYTVTWLGSLKLLLPLAVVLSFLLLTRGHQREFYLFNLGFFGATAMTYLLKFLLARERPGNVLSPEALPPDPSFPSAHTTQAFGFAIMLWLVAVGLSGQWRAGTALVLLLLAVSVALSRIYLQVHFPSDVLAGVLVALSWGAFMVIVGKSGTFT
jgi:undecaprenyl-diphosphatase